MGKIAKRIILVVIKYLFCYIACFFVGFSIVGFLNDISNTNLVIGTYWVLGIDIIISLGVVIFLEYLERNQYETKFTVFISTYGIHFITVISIVVLCFSSIRVNHTIEFNILQNMLNLAWSIFGIVVTVYLVWKVIVPQFLDKLQPKNKESESIIEQHFRIRFKSNFIAVSSIYFSIEILFLFALVFLWLGTITIYLVDSTGNFCQSVICIALQLCIFSIILFLITLYVSDGKSREIVKKNKITDEDIKIEKNLKAIIEQLSANILNIYKNRNMSDKQKFDKFVTLLNTLSEVSESTADDSDTGEQTGLKNKDGIEG